MDIQPIAYNYDSEGLSNEITYFNNSIFTAKSTPKIKIL